MSKVWFATIFILLLFSAIGWTEDDSYKNVHLFTKLSKSEITRVMNFMRASLGVHCDYCHVVSKDGWDWGNDSKAPKIKARQMISMVAEINKANFKGKPEVSCFTCHQGRIRPNGTPPLPQEEPPYPTPIRAAETIEVNANQILEGYVQATGGEAGSKIRHARTLILRGATNESWKRKVVPYEVHYKAPDKWLVKKTLEDGVYIQVLNGANGWVQEGTKTRTMADRELGMFQDTIDSLRLLPEPPSSKPVAVTKRNINDRSAFSLEYKLSEVASEFFYFDAETRLILGRKRYILSPVGEIPQQINYENFKELQGARVPYTLRADFVDPWIGGSFDFTEILVDAPLDDAEFQMPSQK